MKKLVFFFIFFCEKFIWFFVVLCIRVNLLVSLLLREFLLVLDWGEYEDLVMEGRIGYFFFLMWIWVNFWRGLTSLLRFVLIGVGIV